MTRKDYELIADCLYMANNKSGDEWDRAVEHVALSIAESLSEDNPHFDRDNFLKTCGIE